MYNTLIQVRTDVLDFFSIFKSSVELLNTNTIQWLTIMTAGLLFKINQFFCFVLLWGFFFIILGAKSLRTTALFYLRNLGSNQSISHSV